VDMCGKSLYIDLNELQTYRRDQPQPQPKVEEATRKNAKSILLTEDVLSVNFNALSSQRHSYCDRTDLEPDLIQDLPTSGSSPIYSR
jgi:hypothetical protein